jgi:hypothetical protein
MTPEGKVKNKLKQLLDKYEGRIYVNWPVPRGYGSPTLDCWGAIRGVPFAIETKAPGKAPTSRQDGTIEDMMQGGIAVFATDYDGAQGSEASYLIIEAWFEEQDRR